MAPATILIADHLYTPDGFVSERAIALDHRIRAIDTSEALMQRYPDASIHTLPPHTVLYPGLINAHVHLEFSANRTTLQYGDFMRWLDSVIVHRDALVAQCDTETMYTATRTMLESGITHLGAISSTGTDLEVCRTAPQRVTYYTELIGASAATADALYGDFISRLEQSMQCGPDARMTPAIAIHAPYSVHPVLLHKAVALAKKHALPLTTHFLESAAEREWLEHNRGGFRAFFQKFFGTDKAVTSIDEFLHAFDGHPTLFVHATHTHAAERRHLEAQGHRVAHCPRSNRLLGCGRLPIEDFNLPLCIATDGLSSNTSLSLWDEMRATLMLHHRGALEPMAERCIRAVTSDAARAVGSDGGRLAPGAPADLIAVTLPGAVERPEQLALQTILHTHRAAEVYIDGIREI